MAVTSVRLQRFSPLFANPKQWGLHNIQASQEYRAIYPFEQNDLDDLAYSFNTDFSGQENVIEYTRPLLEAVENWVKYWSANEPPMLAFERNSGGGLTIYDTRPCHSNSIIELEGDEAIAYLACDAKHSISFIAAEVKKQRGNANDTALRRVLDDLVERRLMLKESDQYLSLANDLAVLEKNVNTMLPFLLVHKAVNC
jgi:magnesium-protoporphyrin IX monomethyl ester (oxidative) cyclase